MKTTISRSKKVKDLKGLRTFICQVFAALYEHLTMYVKLIVKNTNSVKLIPVLVIKLLKSISIFKKTSLDSNTGRSLKRKCQKSRKKSISRIQMTIGFIDDGSKLIKVNRNNLIDGNWSIGEIIECKVCKSNVIGTLKKIHYQDFFYVGGLDWKFQTHTFQIRKVLQNTDIYLQNESGFQKYVATDGARFWFVPKTFIPTAEVKVFEAIKIRPRGLYYKSVSYKEI